MKTEIWADIRDQVAELDRWPTTTPLGRLGRGDRRRPAGEGRGPDPALVGDEGAAVNGRFLWIEDGLQAPDPELGEPADERPW